MKTSEVFREAKKLVYLPRESYTKGKNQFICLAIQDVVMFKDSYQEQIIMERLNKHYTFEAWLVGEHKKKITTKADRAKVQEARHAWLDSLIAEFEAKGD